MHIANVKKTAYCTELTLRDSSFKYLKLGETLSATKPHPNYRKTV